MVRDTKGESGHIYLSSFTNSFTRWSGWHADIKPANILLIEDKFRLADPGFAQFVADGVVQEATAVMRGGTVAYGKSSCDMSIMFEKLLTALRGA